MFSKQFRKNWRTQRIPQVIFISQKIVESAANKFFSEHMKNNKNIFAQSLCNKVSQTRHVFKSERVKNWSTVSLFLMHSNTGPCKFILFNQFLKNLFSGFYLCKDLAATYCLKLKNQIRSLTKFWVRTLQKKFKTFCTVSLSFNGGKARMS